MPEIGQTVLHFRIIEKIGQGGMGEVYQAKDQKLGRDVAIKVLPEEFARDADRVARFQREARLLASLNHPNIAAIYGLEEGEVHIYVRPFPEVNQNKWKISTERGGESPRWSSDSRKIFYLTQNGDAVMEVPIETEPTFSPGKPREINRRTFVSGIGESPPYDVHPDGRFLMIKQPALQDLDALTKEAGLGIPNKIIIVTNWFEELKERMALE